MAIHTNVNLSPIDARLSDLPEISRDVILSCLDEQEYGDARLFALLFKGKVVKDHTENKWYVWRGHYWEPDKTRQTRHLVSGVLASLYLETAARLNLERSRQNMTGAKEEIAAAAVKELAKRGEGLRNLERTRRVLEYAESFLAITGDVWDKNPWVLGTQDGVIELKDGSFRPGRPDDYIRTIIGARWEGLDKEAPRFERFLQEIFSDRTNHERDEIILFLQRALGYGITGLVREHVFLLLYGEEGRNGKDTLMTVINSVMGKTVGPVSNDVLLATGKGNNPGTAKPHLVNLQGKRIAWASEPDKGSRFDVGQVKLLTGGGDITGRGLYEQERTFSPSHLLLLLSNYKPHADPQDKAFWERLCPVVFRLRFVANPKEPNERLRDTNLTNELESESAGVLSWLVRGCLNWQKNGLCIPAQVIRERQAYCKEEDSLHIYVQERCVDGPEYEVSATDLYGDYKEWAFNGNLKPLSSIAFSREMQKKFTRIHTRECWKYTGIGLQSFYGSRVPEETKPEDETDIIFQQVNRLLSLYLTRPYVHFAQTADGQAMNAEQTKEYIEKTTEYDRQAGLELASSILDIWKEEVTRLDIA